MDDWNYPATQAEAMIDWLQEGYEWNDCIEHWQKSENYWETDATPDWDSIKTMCTTLDGVLPLPASETAYEESQWWEEPWTASDDWANEQWERADAETWQEHEWQGQTYKKKISKTVKKSM